MLAVRPPSQHDRCCTAHTVIGGHVHGRRGGRAAQARLDAMAEPSTFNMGVGYFFTYQIFEYAISKTVTHWKHVRVTRVN